MTTADNVRNGSGADWPLNRNLGWKADIVQVRLLIVLLLSLMAALASGTAASAATTSIETAKLPELFEATCLNARLPASGAVLVNYERLPATLRDELKHPSTTRVWQLNTAGRAYLYVVNYPPSPGIAATVCGLASDAVDFETATNWVLARSDDQSMIRVPIVFNMRAGYLLQATIDDDFTVLQVNWMKEADWLDLQKRLH